MIPDPYTHTHEMSFPNIFTWVHWWIYSMSTLYIHVYCLSVCIGFQQTIQLVKLKLESWWFSLELVGHFSWTDADTWTSLSVQKLKLFNMLFVNALLCLKGGFVRHTAAIKLEWQLVEFEQMQSLCRGWKKGWKPCVVDIGLVCMYAVRKDSVGDCMSCVMGEHCLKQSCECFRVIFHLIQRISTRLKR